MKYEEIIGPYEYFQPVCYITGGKRRLLETIYPYKRFLEI